MPPPHTAAGAIAKAVVALEEHPLAASIGGPVARQLDYLAPEMGFGLRLAMTNRWLLGGVIEEVMSGTAAGRAQLRTTTAVTMLSASDKDNVLPPRARAVANFRIKPGDTVETVERHVKEVVGPDYEVSVLPGDSDPPPVSPVNAEPFTLMQRTVAEVFPEAVFAPSLVVATTDARAYAGFAENVYRFMPVPLDEADLARIHGANERIGVADYARAIRFYARLIENAAGG